MFRPINAEAEKALLGLALDDEGAAHEVAKLSPELFASPEYRLILGAIGRCLEQGITPDIATVPHELNVQGKLAGPDSKNEVSVEAVLECWEKRIVSGQIKAYALLLQQAEQQRRLIDIGRSLLDKTQKRFLSPEELAQATEFVQHEAFRLSTGADLHGPKPVQQVMSAKIASIETRSAGELAKAALSTGFKKLDQQTGGLMPGQLIILCCRPSVGKTAFGVCLALSVSQSTSVYFASLEMSAEELGDRFLSKETGVSLLRLRTGSIAKPDISCLVTAAGEIAERKLIVDDSPTMTPAQLRARLRSHPVQHGQSVGLVVVDYLQLMNSGKKLESREREIAHLSRELKMTAKELQIPVVVMCQLNRDLERRPDKRPIMADIRESGAVEQDADVILGLYRPFLYTNRDEDREKAELILLKQRNGPIGMIPLRWHPESASFADGPELVLYERGQKCM